MGMVGVVIANKTSGRKSKSVNMFSSSRIWDFDGIAPPGNRPDKSDPPPGFSTSNKFDVVVSHVYQYLDTVFKHATHCYMHYCSQWPRGYIAVNERQTHHIHCLRPRGRLLTGLVWEGERDFVGGGAAADDGGVERAMSERGREGAAPLCFHWNGRRADEWRALCSLAHVRKEGRRIEVGRPPRFLDNLGFGRAFRGTAPSVPT